MINDYISIKSGFTSIAILFFFFIYCHLLSASINKLLSVINNQKWSSITLEEVMTSDVWICTCWIGANDKCLWVLDELNGVICSYGTLLLCPSGNSCMMISFDSCLGNLELCEDVDQKKECLGYPVDSIRSIKV